MGKVRKNKIIVVATRRIPPPTGIPTFILCRVSKIGVGWSKTSFVF